MVSLAVFVAFRFNKFFLLLIVSFHLFLIWFSLKKFTQICDIKIHIETWNMYEKYSI